MLNPAHPEGRHKARVFLAALGVDANDAEWLASTLRKGIEQAECELGAVDGFGARFTAELIVEREGRTARVRTAWIIRTDQDLPRLVTCFVV